MSFLLSTAVTLAALELIVGRFAPQQIYSVVEEKALNCYRTSDYLPYEYRPGCSGRIYAGGQFSSISINALGMPDKEIRKKSGPRVLLVGDSFVYGYGVAEAERIGAVLEQSLGVEVINMGFVGDAGPDVSYAFLSKVGMSLEPDVVAVTIFPYNDLGDVEKTRWEADTIPSVVKMPDKWVDEKGYLRSHKTQLRYKIPLLKESQLFFFTLARLESVTYRLKLIERKLGGEKWPLAEDAKFRRCLLSGYCEDKWRGVDGKIRRTIQSLEELAVQHDVPLVFVLVPYTEQISQEDSSETIFHRILKEEQARYIDLFPVLHLSGYGKEDLYLPDGHWTVYGHQIAAEAIRDFLEPLVGSEPR